ncbi:MAG: hypothetical protein H0W94_07610 [Actinobacteria bacterium]|nr:hypothetical protein [Actinomycetota bacterium]
MNFQMAEKQVTPKAPDAATAGKDIGKAATRVTKRATKRATSRVAKRGLHG